MNLPLHDRRGSTVRLSAMPVAAGRWWRAWLMLIAANGAVAAEAPQVDETWQVTTLQGQRIGYSHNRAWEETRDGRTLHVTETHVHSVIKRFGGKVTVIIDQRTEEEADGTLRAFSLVVDNPPASRIETRGTISGEVLKLTISSAGQEVESEQAVPAGVRSSSFPDRDIARHPLAVDETRRYLIYDPQLSTAATIRATGRGNVEYELPDGSKQSGPHVEIEFLDGIPGLRIDSYFDDAGRAVLTNVPLLASSTWTVDKEVALAEIPDDLDLGLAAVIKVDPIVDPYRTRRVKYRITCESGLSPDMFSQGDTQSVQVTSDTELELTVSSIRPGDDSATQGQESPPAEYLAATSMANHEDEPIQKLAAAAAPVDAAPVDIAIGAERAVREWLTKANMSSNLATASEVVRSREGDCTEHAVLLTAVLRARQIPARTVIGLVYFEPESAFAGHAWTEAWLDGRWVPLDATLALRGIGATHIKLGDTSLADGESGLLLGAVTTWRLLDQAAIRVIEVEQGGD